MAGQVSASNESGRVTPKPSRRESRSRAETVTSIDRATDVLVLFAENGNRSLGVTEIAHTLGLSKAVVHRILTSFRAKGFIEIDEHTHRYRLGPRVLHLGFAYMDGIDVRGIARPVLEELSRATNETSTLSIRSGFARVYVDQVTPQRDVKMVVQLGRHEPLHAGASSKALLAFLNPSEIDEYLSQPLEKLTPLTITNPKTLRRELAEIRRLGFAVSMGERLEGAGSVAAPILGYEGIPAGVISLSGPVDRFRDVAPRASKVLLEATNRLSEKVGYSKARADRLASGSSQ